jgi:AraC family transcriptional regulator
VQITKAKTYLLETNLPLKEIAYRLGFSSAANFSSAFRLATGSSPGQFRSNQ